MMCTSSASVVRQLAGVLTALVMLFTLVGAISPVAAEPVAIRSTPLDGEVLQRTPTAVGVGFDQALDREQSTFDLLNINGGSVPDINVVWGTDNSSATITLPRDFPDGVYTTTWHAVAASDGTALDGWSSFSVGNPEDASIITIPTSESGHQGPPTWLKVGARAIALIGIAASIAIWPVWRGVIRPALGRMRPVGVRTTIALQQWAWIALTVAFVGSLAEMAVHSITVRDAGLIEAIMQTLGNDEWGFWWIVRMALLVALGIGLAISPWWYPTWARLNNYFLWGISLLLPAALVFSGHATQDSVGRITIAASSYLAILALSSLAGGALYLAILLLTVRKDITLAASEMLRSRFAWLVVSAGSIAIITSLYLGLVFVGNGEALTQTGFGHMQIAQIIVGSIALVIAVMLLARRFTASGSALLAALMAAAMALTMVPTAGMDVSTPARTELVERSVQTLERLDFDGRSGIFLVAPGRAGVNHLRLETPGTYLQTETEVFIELSTPDFPQIGTKTFQMYRVQGNAFEHHGTELSLIGEWEVTVRIEEPGFPSSISTYRHVFGEENTSVTLPSAPIKFNTTAGLAAIALLIVGVLGIGTALTSGNSPLRKEAGGLSVIAIGLGIVMIIQGQIDPVLVVEGGEGAINPSDMVMVTRGEESYLTYCASCHGTGLRGDGPLSDALNPPAADFSAPHTKVHRDEDYIYWIQYGIQGTAMPGFKSQLTDQDIRDIIAYIYYWQKDDGVTAGTSAPMSELGVCEVAQFDFADLQAIFAHGLHPSTRRGTPLVRAADSSVSPEHTNEVMWTIEQLVNCANQDQFLSQVPLFTKSMLMDIFPQGVNWEVTSRATTPPSPVDAADAIKIQDVQGVNLLADGRVAVTVIFSDPLAIGVIPGALPVYQVTLILINEDGIWLIDEVR